MIDALVSPPAIAGEPLDPEGLRDLVDGLARTPGLWSPRVRHDSGQRIFDLLWLDERVEVWLICWGGEGHDTGFHDHDISSGAFAVVRGELVEERLTIGRTIRRRLKGGQSLAFPPSHVHRVHGVDRTPAVSIHAYSPPLARLGVYALSDDGALRRESVAASHELRSEPTPRPAHEYTEESA
jgi:mannose-6-phosphate isomerase-like protein (cupin superfamily)